MNEKFKILEKDFLFNLTLINERDGDLKLQEREIATLLETIKDL